MKDVSKTVAAWIKFTGFVLIIAVLYWAQAIIVPIALAILLTFLLAPLALWLQRWMGRLPAVLVLVVLLFSVLGVAVWGLARELSSLANELPGYRANIRQKIADVRGAGTGGSVEKVQQTLTDIQTELAKGQPQSESGVQPIVVTPPEATGVSAVRLWITSIVEPLATAGLVIVLVVFMLLEREDLRARLIRLFGHGHLAITTKAFDEAATRISRYLLMQSLINATFGAGVAIGLHAIGVPYALLWAALAAALRFIPYLGPWIAAVAPLAVALAALPGWLRPLEVLGLFMGLELLTNWILEPVLYAGAAGVSELALLVAIAFWTWLWGPLGLLMATPLTVCFVVLAKHVPGLEFVQTLMADTPALEPDVGCYQRLLARDQSEAADLIERYIKTEPPEAVYDALLLPALNYAERDRLADQLSLDEERGVVEAIRELMDDAAKRPQANHAAETAAGDTPVRILGCAPNSDADELALRMLEELVRQDGISIDVASTRMLSSDLVDAVRKGGYRLVCIADLPPSPPSKTRYLVKKLRAALPDLKILVGRWAPPSLADETAQPLLEAGADHVGSKLIETREKLREIVKSLPDEAADMGSERTA